MIPFAAPVAEPPALVLNADSILCEQALGEPALLVDGRTDTAFFAGWTAWRYPVRVVVDLGAEVRLERVVFYNDTGTPKVRVEAGNPFAWQPVADVSIAAYRDWFPVTVSATTRWLRLTLDKPASLWELKVFGTPTGKPGVGLPQPALRPARPRPTLDALMGVNAFVDDPLDTVTASATFVREYHNWPWDEGDGKPYPGYPKNQNAFQPSAAAGGNAWFFDDFYAGLKRRGAVVVPAIQSTPSWLSGADDRGRNPHPPGADPENPASYVAHADHLFQFAARYGRRRVDDSLLKLAPGQPRHSGLGLLSWIENGNEWDKDWEGAASHMDPYALAALASADYDGHRGALGKGVGVRAADPSMKMALSGLVGVSLPTLRAIRFWSAFRRGGDFPADALNVHHYGNDPSKRVGISPEADDLRGRLAALVAWRDANVPKAEVWITEYGWDTHPASPQRAPAIGKKSAEEVQGEWLVRALLAIAAAGVDRAALYMLRDVNAADATQYSTSGIVTAKGEWKPKIAYHYLATLKRHLAGFRFAGEQTVGDPRVRAYRFASGRGRALALWLPTAEDAPAATVHVSVPGGAHLLRLNPGSDAGAVQLLKPDRGRVTVDVDERPCFLFWGE